MPSVYSNFHGGQIIDNPLSTVATQINSTQFSSLPVIDAPNTMWLVLDPEAIHGLPEIVQVTAHSSGSSIITVVRGQQLSRGGFPARLHPFNTRWVVGWTAEDAEEARTSANASNLTEGTVPSGRLSGAYPDITAVGTRLSNLTTRARVGMDDGVVGSTSNTQSLELHQPNVASGDAYISFTLTNRWNGNFGLDTATNDLFVGGGSWGATKYRIVHSGNWSSLSPTFSSLTANSLAVTSGTITSPAGTVNLLTTSGTINVGSSVSTITVGNDLVVSGDLIVQGTTTTTSASTISGGSVFASDAVATVPVRINAFAGQTGNLTEWRSSDGAILAKVTAAGVIDGSFTGTFTGTVSGNGSGVTDLNATNLTSGTVASARISGAYGGITAVGTLTGLTTAGLTSTGTVNLTNATSNLIAYSTAGVAAPTFTTRSAGTKVVLFPNIGASAVDYALGIEASTLWLSVPTTSQQFKFYGGTTNIATLSGTGALTLSGSITQNVSGSAVTHHVITTSTNAVGTKVGMRLSTGSGWSTSFYTEQGNWWHAFGDSTGTIRWGYDGTDLKVGTSKVWHAGNDGAASTLDADLLDGQEGSWYRDWANITNKPDPVVALDGDVQGTATMTDLGSITIQTFIQPNSVALGTDTTGQYARTLIGTANRITVTTPNADDGTDYTLTLPQDIHTAAAPQFGSARLLNTINTNVVLTVQGEASQVADLQQWKTPSTVLARVDTGGKATFKEVYVDTSTAGTTSRVGLLAASGIDPSKLYIVNDPNNANTVPSYLSVTTPFYADSYGNFSLGDSLWFAPSDGQSFGRLTVIGRIRGAIENTPIVPTDSGQFTVDQVVISGASPNQTAVIRTTTSHTFNVGDTVVIAGIDLASNASAVNGAWAITAKTTVVPYTFTITGLSGATNGTYSATGTARVRELTLGLHPPFNGSPAGLGIRLDEYNYWFVNNRFRVGSGGVGATTYMEWDGSNLVLSGRVIARSGDFQGAVTVNGGTMQFGKDAGGTNNHGIYIGPGLSNYWYSTGAFNLGGSDGITYLGSSNITIGSNVTINGSAMVSGSISGVSIAIGTLEAGVAPFNVSSGGVLTARSGTVGGWTMSNTTLTGGDVLLGTTVTLANTGDITVGTGTNIARLSASDATYRLWIGHATAASAPFQVTAAGALTATNATISGTITSTLGTIGGWTLGGTTLTGGNTTLDSTGNITVGAGDAVARMSATDLDFRFWAGNATATSAPFRVSAAGALTATGATVTGTISANNFSLLSGSTTVATLGSASIPVFVSGSGTTTGPVIGFDHQTANTTDSYIGWTVDPLISQPSVSLIGPKLIDTVLPYYGYASISLGVIRDTLELGVLGDTYVRMSAPRANDIFAPSMLIDSNGLRLEDGETSIAVTVLDVTVEKFAIGKMFIGASVTSLEASALVNGVSTARSWLTLGNASQSWAAELRSHQALTLQSTNASITASVPTGATHSSVVGGTTRLSVTGTGATVTGTMTATTFSGSGASLTAIPAGQLTGIVDTACIAGSYTGITAVGTLTGLTTSGNIILNNATSKIIQFSSSGVGAPSFTTRSAGTKIVLYSGPVSATRADYALGIESSTFWSGVPSTFEQFRWYGGTSLLMTLSGAGALTLTSSVTGTSIVGSNSLRAGSGSVGMDIKKRTGDSFMVLSPTNSTDDNDYVVASDSNATFLRARSGNNIGLMEGNSTRFQTTNGVNISHQVLRPSVNTISLGDATVRWAQLFAMTSTISTSDVRAKFDISDTPLGLSFINRLRPVVYRLLEGSREVVETVWNPDTLSEEPVYKTVPGVRLHAGLIGQEVRDALDAEGFADFAGWCLDDANDSDSRQSLRYEEFISPLIRAVQELSARVEELESLS